MDGLVEGLQMPKNMRWAGQTLRFARPIRTVTVLHGADVLEAEVAGVRSGAHGTRAPAGGARSSSCPRPMATSRRSPRPA